MELRRLEEREELLQDEQKLRGFNREIRDTYDKNLNEKLDNALENIIENHRLEESEILYYIRKYIQEVKESLK